MFVVKILNNCKITCIVSFVSGIAHLLIFLLKSQIGGAQIYPRNSRFKLLFVTEEYWAIVGGTF